MTVARNKAVTLYRSLLKAHSKYLPAEMRSLGDAYVKAEFRMHKNVTNQDHLSRFYEEWYKYLDQIQQTARAREMLAVGITEDTRMKRDESQSSDVIYSFGKDLDSSIQLTDEQKSQLEKLREETSKIHKE
jgi:hypothetical protein